MNLNELESLKSCVTVLGIIARRESGENYLSSQTVLDIIQPTLERARKVLAYYLPETR